METSMLAAAVWANAALDVRERAVAAKIVASIVFVMKDLNGRDHSRFDRNWQCCQP
jgi:hypothetical protein